MKTREPTPDPLEPRLRRVPFRELPPAWRDDILAEARAAVAPRSAVDELRCPAWWRLLLRPKPVAWAGLAAAWVAVLALNHAGRWEPASSLAVAPGSASGLGLALSEHRRQLNELLEGPAAEPAPTPAPGPSAPRGALTRTNRVA